MMKKWKIGAYQRRSFDDGEVEESNTIINQRKIIEDYLNDKKDITIYKEYSDDGFTGTDFYRPGFQKMMEDITRGKINGVIVKDLSRIGRNYIEVGDFIDEVLPRYNLRLIAINDNIDSYLNPECMNNIDIPIRNLMNENYAKDASKKMRSSLIASKKSGNFVGNIAPYGYLKDPNNYHKLIIDKEVADNIKYIFNQVLEGKSKTEIVESLNRKHIPTPSKYLNNKYNKKVVSENDQWTTHKLDRILQNKVYKGTLEQNKKTRISHKIHNTVVVPEEERIFFDNAHKPLIRPEIYEQVQNIIYNRNAKVNKDGKLRKYNGYLKCSECGSSLYRFCRVKKGIKRYYYYCGTYSKSKQCNKHFINEYEIDETVLEIVNKYIELLLDLKNKICEFVDYSEIEYNNEINSIRKEELNIEISNYKKKINNLLIDYKNEFITKDDYEDFKEKYLYELNKLNLEKDKLNTKDSENNLLWLEQFKVKEKFEKVDRRLVINFIDEIRIGNNKEIEIDLKFKNQYNGALDYLKRHNL